MKFTEIAGELDISPDAATTFIKSWFAPEDRITVVGRRTIRTGSLDVVSQTMSAKELIEALDDQLLETLIFDPDGSSYNLYIGVCPVVEDLGLFKRGTKTNIAYVPGVWADIDIKDGGFESEDAILSWLMSLPVRPSIICGSGSGGVHAYWRFHWGQHGTEATVEQWWAYLDEMAGERSIDKLVDATRILRIPGSVYFPKPEAASSKLKMVKLIDAPGITYDMDQLLDLSADAFARRIEKRNRLRNEDAQRRLDTDSLARALLADEVVGRWALMRAIAAVEDYANQELDWFSILVPHGWTHRKSFSDGSNEWARPGQNDRSAVTDYEGSPVMSLLSTSEDTGLADLKDAGIHLSRYRVALRLMYNDDEAAMVRDMVDKMKKIKREH